MARRDPRAWAPDQVRSLASAVYLGDYQEGDNQTGRAAVVFHLPEKMMPRRTLREFKKSHQGHGPWPPFRWYALVWCQTNIDYAIMGDDTVYDVVRPGNSFGDLNAACSEAEEWLRAAGEDIRPVAWDNLPPVAQTFASAAVRRGF